MISSDGSRPGVKLSWYKSCTFRLGRVLRRANRYARGSRRESDVIESGKRGSSVYEAE